MLRYPNTSWHIDNGGEQTWYDPIWSNTLQIIARHEGEEVYNSASPIYTQLRAELNSVAWIDRQGRPAFRDFREAWTSTGTLSIDSGRFQLTPLGQEFCQGHITRDEVFTNFFCFFQKDGIYPYRIICSAFLESRNGLTLYDIITAVMQNYRPGVDNLEQSISEARTPKIEITDNTLRRLRVMIKVLSDVGTLYLAGGSGEQALWKVRDKKMLQEISLAGFAEKAVRDFQMDGLIYEPKLIIRYTASLLAKRFLILTGLSGSGKTRLALSIAEWLATNNREQVALVPVGADWTGNDNIIGYPDALSPQRYVSTPTLDIVLRALKKPHLPYFLILDEMNLSHVERYLNDFLSALESNQEIPLYNNHTDAAPRKNDGQESIPSSIRLPANLFIIGTVNIDETTHMLSPKVLDRANVIEFTASREQIRRVAQPLAFQSNERLVHKGSEYASAFNSAAAVTDKDILLNEPVQSKFSESILLLFDVLKLYNSEFASRTVKEMKRFFYYQRLIEGTEWEFMEALDAQIAQKILPKLNGSRKKLEPILASLVSICRGSFEWQSLDSLTNTYRLGNRDAMLQTAQEFSQPIVSRGIRVNTLSTEEQCPISMNKILRMLRNLEQDGFTSFAEA